ncbi:MAG: electron transport complex subunit RsxA [Peptococcaceae bacterium]|jgi:electron transport complex protein RnfA|nr:electron transport complex subunit RsxA [Peptococcaceae bacterium]
MQTLLIFMSAVLVNNFVLNRFLGICPFLGVSKKMETALGMGVAVIFVMALASAVTYLVYNFILVPLDLNYLYNIAFILIIASLVQLVEMFLKKFSPSLYQALGIFLPLITTNCAVLGVTVINMESQYNLVISVVHAVGAAIGFTLAIVLYASIRERIAKNPIPAAFQGFPIALITASLMSIAFLGFSGLIKV